MILFPSKATRGAMVTTVMNLFPLPRNVMTVFTLASFVGPPFDSLNGTLKGDELGLTKGSTT